MERAARRSRAGWLALSLPGALATAVLLRWPVVPLDSDLWMHLLAGSRILAEGAIPRESFFSFLEPPRAWSDNHWLFQAALSLLHAAAGYPGLILLRAAAFASVAALLVLILEDRPEGAPPRLPLPWACALLGLFAVALWHRFLLVRPHLLDFVLLAGALFVLERRPSWTPALPGLGLLWANAHGATYPVWLLALGAYALEALPGLGSAESRAAARRRLPWLAAAAATVLLSPLGTRLLGLPFLPRDYMASEVTELLPVTPRQLLSFSLSAGAPLRRTAFNLIFWLSLAAAGLALSRRRARAAHLVLLAGGLALLTQGARFRHEAALLAWPLLCAVPPTRTREELPRWAWEALVLAALALPVLAFRAPLLKAPAWPLSTAGLPAGVTAFLKERGPGGLLLNHPSSGGWYQWELYPRYKIAMDMNILFLFSERDLRETASAYRDPAALDRLVSRYRPDFIAAPLTASRFPALIARHRDYAPVFVDDAEALYADSRRHAALVRDWRLPFDPFAPRPEPGPGQAGKGCALPDFLSRQLEVYPRGLLARSLAARYCLAGGDFDGALRHASALIRDYPDLPDGRLLRVRARQADARRAQER